MSSIIQITSWHYNDGSASPNDHYEEFESYVKDNNIDISKFTWHQKIFMSMMLYHGEDIEYRIRKVGNAKKNKLFDFDIVMINWRALACGKYPDLKRWSTKTPPPDFITPQCICTKKGLKYNYYIGNIYNGRGLIVGSCCIEKFTDTGFLPICELCDNICRRHTTKRKCTNCDNTYYIVGRMKIWNTSVCRISLYNFNDKTIRYGSGYKKVTCYTYSVCCIFFVIQVRRISKFKTLPLYYSYVPKWSKKYKGLTLGEMPINYLLWMFNNKDYTVIEVGNYLYSSGIISEKELDRRINPECYPLSDRD